jgi:hypothetical protein
MECNSWQAQNIFMFSKVSNWLWAHQAPYSVHISSSSPSPSLIKQLGHKADHSPLSRAPAENEGSYTSTPLVCLHSASRQSFTLTFTLIFTFTSNDKEEKVKYRFGNNRITSDCKPT